MQVDSKPEETRFDGPGDHPAQIEQEALKKETDAGSKSRLKTLDKELPTSKRKSPT